MVLRGVVTQRLVPARSGGGGFPAVEILTVTTAVSHRIRTGRPQQIDSAMETGMSEGMQTLEQSLAELVALKRIREEDALQLARNERIYRQRLQRMQQGEPMALKGSNDGRLVGRPT